MKMKVHYLGNLSFVLFSSFKLYLNNYMCHFLQQSYFVLLLKKNKMQKYISRMTKKSEWLGPKTAIFVFYEGLFPIIILRFLTIKCTKVIQQSIYYKEDINTVYSLLHPGSYTVGTGSFPEVKRPGRGVDHPPPSSAEVEGRVQSYICSPSGNSCPVVGWNLPLAFYTPFNSKRNLKHK